VKEIRMSQKLLRRYFIILMLSVFVVSAFAETGPGGVGDADGTSDLSLWLRADLGVEEADGDSAEYGDEILYWRDQSGFGYDAERITAYDNESVYGPTYSATGGGNSLPSLSFDGIQTTGDGLSVPGNDETKPEEEITIFVAGTMNNGASSYDVFVSSASDDADDDGYGIFQENNKDEMALWAGSYDKKAKVKVLGTNEIWCLIFNTTNNKNYGYRSESNPIDKGFNGPIIYEDDGVNSDVQIGAATDNTKYEYFLDGEIEEIIIYAYALTDAERIIVSNHLSSKYDISLDNNDFYDGDTSGNGDYDFDVIGLGEEADGSHTLSRAAGLVLDDNNTFLTNNGDFLLAGHDGTSNSIVTTDIADSVVARWDRIWYLDRTDPSATSNGNVKIGFDFSEGEVGGSPAGSSSNYRLLYRSGTSGDFSELTTVSVSYSGDVVTFEVADGPLIDGYYTLGTINEDESPLPVTLTAFSASFLDNNVVLQWITASESNNIGWNVYRSISQNLGQALQINQSLLPGAGNSTVPTYYEFADVSLLDFIELYNIDPTINFWYWLESVDYEGVTELHGPISLHIPHEEFDPGTPDIPGIVGLLQNYPNPFNPGTEILFTLSETDYIELVIYDVKGRVVKTLFKGTLEASEGDLPHTFYWDGTDSKNDQVASGIYLYRLITSDQDQMKKMILSK